MWEDYGSELCVGSMVREEDEIKDKIKEYEILVRTIYTGETMSLFDDMKQRMIECVKNGNSQERDVLRTLVGEIQSKSIGSGKEITDEVVEKTLVSFKENALECAKYAHQDDPADAVDSLEANFEVAIYDKYLPQYETVESIITLLAPSQKQLQSAKADGPATGMAMGILKKSGAKVQGKDVKTAVETIRNAPEFKIQLPPCPSCSSNEIEFKIQPMENPAGIDLVDRSNFKD